MGGCGERGGDAWGKDFTPGEWNRAQHGPLAKKSIRGGKCRNCAHKGLLNCKRCYRRRDRDHFEAFLQTPTAKTNLGDACCDDCWNPTKGLLTCKHCHKKRDSSGTPRAFASRRAPAIGRALPSWRSLACLALFGSGLLVKPPLRKRAWAQNASEMPNVC